MKAFVVKEYAHPSNIPLAYDAPEPKAGPTDVIVDVYSAGLNFFDVSIYSHAVYHDRRRNTIISPRFFKPRESIKINLRSHS